MRIAVFGAGLIGQKHIAVAAGAGHLAAIVDPNPQVAELARDLGCSYYANPEDCLDSEDLDGVIVATPNQLHAEHGRICIARKLPVLIEKPLVESADEGGSLVAQAAEASVPILVGHHRRHNPIIQKAVQAVRAGDLGDIVAVTGHFLLFKPDAYFDVDWRRKPGGGPILINLIHDIDLLRFVVGDIVEVMAMQSSQARGFEVEDTACILFRFENGALGTFALSDTAVSPWSWEFTSGENPAYPNAAQSAYHVAGTRGSLAIPEMRLWLHPGERGWWEPLMDKRLDTEARDPFELQFLHFLDVCRGETPIVSAREGLRSLEVVEAIKKAARSGEAVVLGL